MSLLLVPLECTRYIGVAWARPSWLIILLIQMPVYCVNGKDNIPGSIFCSNHTPPDRCTPCWGQRPRMNLQCRQYRGRTYLREVNRLPSSCSARPLWFCQEPVTFTCTLHVQ
ncbi:hypothetical protein B0T13DRAFT_290254 [Neurospora crassa]|nr:hypothetical protein B0T13DRAFT_290254 [Neurospora crassa]